MKPDKLTDAEIDLITVSQWGKQEVGVMYSAHRAYARGIESARDAQWQPLMDAKDAEIAKLREAVGNLIKVKGRYHTEQAFKKLEDVYLRSKQ
jgi:hypothetical protein